MSFTPVILVGVSRLSSLSGGLGLARLYAGVGSPSSNGLGSGLARLPLVVVGSWMSWSSSDVGRRRNWVVGGSGLSL